MLPDSRVVPAPAARMARPLFVLLAVEVLAFLVSTVPGVGARWASRRRVRPAAGRMAAGRGLRDRRGAGAAPAVRLPGRPRDLGVAGRGGRRPGAGLRRVPGLRPAGSSRRRIPSVADAAWLAMYVLMLAGLVELARRRTRRLSTTLLLDAAVGVLAAAASPWRCCTGPSCRSAAPGTPSSVVVGQPGLPGARPACCSWCSSAC